jgi:galactokinase
MPLSFENTLENPRVEESLIAAIAAHGLFDVDRTVSVARAPARLDVMGGNVDYTGGMVLQGLLREATWVAAQSRFDDTIRVLNPQAAEYSWATCLELKLSDLRTVESVQKLCHERRGWRWGCYVLGALYFLQTFYGGGEARGIDLLVTSDIPPNRGVSSSAALETATLKAAASAWGVGLRGIALATAGQWVENVIAGAACGIMDQAAIVLGEENCLLPLLCQPCQPSTPMKLPEGIRIWGIDSMASRSTSSVSYERARAAAFMAYKLICEEEGIPVVPDKESSIARFTDARWNGYLSNLAPAEFYARFERSLPETLSGSAFLDCCGQHVDPFTRIVPDMNYPVRYAARYAVEENHRVHTLYRLLDSAGTISDSSLQLAGELFYQSHIGYDQCGLGSAACDELVGRVRHAGLPGAKMTGGGEGGVVAILGRAEDAQTVHRTAQEFGKAIGSEPRIFVGSSMGADAFGVKKLYL